MKLWVCALCMVLFAVSPAVAQQFGIFGDEPGEEELGAPIYPGATFIRVMANLDPFYRTVFFVSPDPVGEVKNFYRDELPKARLAQYRDEYEWVWAYLYNASIPFPKKPTRDDLPILDATPNVMVKKYQPMLHEPLEELFESRPEEVGRFEALKKAKTIIRYTYRKVLEDAGFGKLQGVWKNVDKSLPEYYGCGFEFRADSTYIFTLTEENITALAKAQARLRSSAGKTAAEIAADMRANNPERGRFSILRNTMDMETAEPVIGDAVKSGLAEVQDAAFAVQFINMPRLTFVRIHE